jgi:cell division protein FtsB
MLDALEVEKKRLEEDFMYIEKIAREEFKMAKKDEKVFTIIKNKPKKENN